MSKNGKVRCYCSSCKQLTWHDILAKATTSSDDDGFWWNIDYYLVKCCGCDEYTFLTESEDESDVEYDEYGNMTLNTKQKTYPIQQPIAYKLPDLWHILPSKLNKIYNETLDTLNNHCYLLAAAGFRVIVEAICTEENIEGKSLET